MSNPVSEDSDPPSDLDLERANDNIEDQDILVIDFRIVQGKNIIPIYFQSPDGTPPHVLDLEEILDRLTNDSELHKMLAEERMRCEMHKHNYEKIKAQYIK